MQPVFAQQDTLTDTECTDDDIDQDNDGLREICYIEDLDAIRNNLTGGQGTSEQGCPSNVCNGYELVRDLDFTKAQSYASGTVNSVWVLSDSDFMATTRLGWNPIGNFAATATFEGNGYSISNLHINRDGATNVGLFSENSGTIQNLGLFEPEVEGNGRVGGLVGINRGNLINVFIDGGRVRGPRTEDLDNLTGFDLGLLAGDNVADALIINSYVRGTVSGSRWVGGLCGVNIGEIINSYAAADVAAVREAGGLVGESQGPTSNSYATGSIDITAMVRNEGSVGGLLGVLWQGQNTNPRVINSYSTVKVPANEIVGNIGGLIGNIHPTNPPVTDSYWDSETSGQIASAAGTSRTTIELQMPTTATGIYANWNTNDWDFGDTMSYPILRHSNSMNACDEDTTTPFPSCNDVLPGQRGLEVVTFEIIETNGTIRDNARVFAERPFSPIVFDYDIKIPHALTEIKLRPDAINDNATISVIKVGENTELFLNKSSGDLSDIIPLQAGINETLRVMVSGETYNFNLIRGPQNPTAIGSFGTPTANVDEGEDITFTAVLDNVSGSYEYSLRQRDTVLDEGQDTTTTLAITVTIPDTSVDDANVTMQDITYTLEVFDGFDSVSSELMLTVTKIDNGVPQLELRISGSSLTINSTADPDDNPDSLGTFTYQWQSRNEGDNSWTTLADTDNIYPVPGSNANTFRYRVTVTHTDGQGHITNYDTIGPFPADVDGDNDRLIDIYYLEDLDVVRYQADGSSYQINPSSENITGNEIDTGCPNNGCRGYELRRDLDFDADDSYIDATSNKDEWTVTNDSDNGWQPIATVDDPFNAIFNGNNYRISNLQINRDTDDDAYIGLFAALSGDARIENVGLLNVDIEGRGYAGGLVAQSKGAIVNSYVQGGEVMGSQHNVGGLVAINDSDDSNTGVIVSSYVDVITTSTDTLLSGGLVANNKGRIRNSYAAGSVSGTCDVGGLVAENGSGSEIINSYVSAAVNRSGSCTANRAGGLVANNSGLIRNSYVRGRITATGMVGALVAVRTAGTVESSYWDSTNTGIIADTADTEAKTPNELRTPTNADANDENSIYENWNVADWEFGASGEYPILRYNSPSDISTVSVCDDDLDTALPPCGGVLLGQGDRGLSNLLLFADGNPATLNEPFSPSIFTGYTVDIVNKRELELVPYALNPLSDFISIAVNTTRTDFFMGKRSGEQSLRIPLEVGELRLTISVGPDDTNLDTYSVTADITTSTIKITSISPEMINEGDSVSLSAAVTGGDSSLYAYRWSVSPEGLIARRDRRAATPSLNMPADFVPRADNSRDVSIRLSVGDGFENASMSRIVTISKIDNGGPDFVVTMTESEISITGIEAGSDPDGDGTITGYVWQQSPDGNNWTTIPGETSSIYSIQRQDSSTDIFYRAQVTSVDGQGSTLTSVVGPYRIRGDIDDDDDGLIDIYFLEDLNAIRDNLAGQGTEQQGCPSSGCNGYELRRDLDFATTSSYVNVAMNRQRWTVDDFDDNSDTGWMPIGSINSLDCSLTQSRCFGGIFEGNGFSISNLQINRDSTSEIGLFVGNSGTIRNFGLRNIKVEGNTGVGGLVGNNPSNLINVYVEGDSVEGGGNNIGLLAGRNQSSGLIINSYVRGTVSSTGRWVGGISGAARGRIINSYAVADVSADGNVGVLAGDALEGEIRNSYAMGSALLTVDADSDRRVGGLVSTLWFGGSMANSYSTAAVEATNPAGNDIGGLVALRPDDDSIEINDSYWDTDTSGQTDSPGGGTAMTTIELQMQTNETTPTGIYANWSQDDWDFGDEMSYPTLLYNEITGVDACRAMDEPPPLPLCGSLLPGQENLLPNVNTTPTISGIPGQLVRLIEGANTSVEVTIGDADVDDTPASLMVNAQSDTPGVANVSVSGSGATRTIMISGVSAGSAMITVMVDDGNGATNSVSRAQFMVTVEANTASMITITPSADQTLSPDGMINIMVSVEDDNFDAGDSVTLTAMSSVPTAVSVSPGTSTGITDNMPRTFMLTAGQSGMATITFTATDRRGASVSTDLSVRVNTRPTISNIPGQVRLTEGTDTSVDVTIADADAADTPADFIVNAQSDTPRVANVSVSGSGATRTIMISGVSAGSAMITVMVDDRNGATNSVGTARFTVRVEANIAPVIDGPITVSPSPVNEGQRLTITVPGMDANNDRLTYSWSVTSGHSGVDLSGNRVSGNRATLMVPDNLVAAASTSTTVSWRVMVSDRTASATGAVSVVVIKRDNGQATVGSLRRASGNDRMLTLTGIVLANDPDGGGMSNTVAYQWQRCWGSIDGTNCSVSGDWVNISSTNSDSYTIPTSLSGHMIAEGDRFRIGVTYTDGQGHINMQPIYSGSLDVSPSTEVRIRSKVFLEGPLQ